MPVTFAHRTISHVAVIGSGQIGPDIALHFAKVLEGVRVTVVDVSEAALAAGKARTWKKLDKGAETGAFKPAPQAIRRARRRAISSPPAGSPCFWTCAAGLAARR